MDTQQLSAFLLIAGFAAMVLSFLLGPPGMAQTFRPPDPHRRIQIIEEYKTRWNISQLLIGLSILVTAIGFAVLAMRLSTLVNAWVPGLGAAAILVGTIPVTLFIYRQTTDPLGSYEGAYTGMVTLYSWLAMAGLLLFGVTFLQAGLPAWLGYLTGGAAIVYTIFFLVTGNGWLAPFLVALLGLVTAIVLLRQ
jgi:hypothetical protein